MGRNRINHEETLARLPAGTLERIVAALEDKETQAAFIREAIARELARRNNITATNHSRSRR